MPTYIEVTNPVNQCFWRKELTPMDYDRVRSYCKGSKEIPIFGALLTPVRVHTWEHFSKDFFFPTLVNQALKVQSSVGRIFAVVFAFIFDAITLPARLFTVIPRLLYASKKEQSGLYQYLQTEALGMPDITEGDYVKVKLGWEAPGRSLLSEEEPELRQYWRTSRVNFIELPFDFMIDDYSEGSQTIRLRR